ncbi:hypothetical protein IL306_013694 [Fusarium sp. DS 682]|nr:hypothetical protein IL306_013694 [Fusarium sp. DS 682]
MAQFNNLPPELRAAIWQYTLPKDENAIYMFNRDWANDFFPSSEHGDAPKIALPARIQVPIPPIYNVCRDARYVVNCWMAKNNIEWYHRQETKENILVRPFDVQRDFLYVPQDMWWDFNRYYINGDGLNEEEQQVFCDNIVNLALSALTITIVPFGEDLAHFMVRLPNLKKVHFIFNDLPTVRKVTIQGPNTEWWCDVPVQQRYEIASAPKPDDWVHVYLRDIQLNKEWEDEGPLWEWQERLEELNVPKVEVTVKEIPTWDIVS